MTTSAYRISKLAPGFDLEAFDCGEPEYNEWLTEHAAQAVEYGSSMVYLLLEQRSETDSRVAGYFAICPTLVVRNEIPKALQRRVLRNAPAWLLAKLALDRSLRGDKVNQWGGQLLRAALETIIDAADRAGGQIVVVDSGNADLVAWYAGHGLIPTGGADLRLYMKTATVRKYLGQNEE